MWHDSLANAPKSLSKATTPTSTLWVLAWGVGGNRISGIVRELKNENIDVIPFTTNSMLYIQRALNPARVNNIVINEEEKRADVFLDPDQVSLAIGKGGQNIKLASMLTGYTIDVFREVEGEQPIDDIYLDDSRTK